ncbi:MAG: hypothetical protein ACKO1F_04480 [Flammeovirgaceae bacterium]
MTTRFAIDTQLTSAAQAYIGAGAAQQPCIRANHHLEYSKKEFGTE